MKENVVHHSAFIHQFAHIGFAKIGARTKVWQFASVIRGAMIGEDCNIASCSIVDGAMMGNRCLIGHGAFLDPGLLIGNDVFIGPNACMCNDLWPLVDKTDWFDMSDLISGGVIVTQIGDGSSIGANATIMPGVTIGANAMVAAGSIVTGNVPDGYLHARGGSLIPVDPTRIQRMKWVSRED